MVPGEGKLDAAIKSALKDAQSGPMLFLPNQRTALPRIGTLYVDWLLPEQSNVLRFPW